MVPTIFERKLIVLFTEALMEPLKGWVKAFDPPSLQETIKKARSMEFVVPKKQFFSKPFPPRKDKMPSHHRDTFPQKKPAPRLDDDALNEYRRKKLCFKSKVHGILTISAR